MDIPEVGDEAPDFELVGTSERLVRLSSFKERAIVVLAFYPADFSPICTEQLRAYSGAVDDFSALDAEVLGISPQSVEMHENFRSALDLRVPLLADVDKEVGRSYGVLGPLGFYRRSMFVVDRKGMIAYAHRSTAGMTFRGVAELKRVVSDLQSS